jgi:hypothetical protein
VPQFVIDSPGGGGKVPLLPEYVESITEDEVVFRNYQGQRYTYKQPRQVPVPQTDVERAAELDVVPIGRKKTAKTGVAKTRTSRRRKAAGE